MISPQSGTLLIANPFLKDPNFMRTVILLCEHQEEGTFGFVLNKEFSKSLDELLPGMEEHKITVYFGGPVQMETLHFVHQYPNIGGEEIIKGVFWGGNFEQLILLIKSYEIDVNKVRFFIGYSGWSSGQLDDEIIEKSWLTVKANRRLIFNQKVQETWKDSLKHLGGEYEMMINFPIDPQLN